MEGRTFNELPGGIAGNLLSYQFLFLVCIDQVSHTSYHRHVAATKPPTTDSSAPSSRLSSRALAMWAKFDRDTDESMPLWRHMADSGAVAGWLWDNQVPSALRRLIADALHGDEDLARRVLVWLASGHDLGKGAPAFAMQVPQLESRITRAGLRFQSLSSAERYEVPHSLASFAILIDWLKERHGWTTRDAAWFAAVPGGHHGRFPSVSPSRLAKVGSRAMGDAAWRSVQLELADYCANLAGLADDDFARLSELHLVQPAAVPLTGLVIFADWLASSPGLFPLQDPRSTHDRLRDGTRRLALPKLWAPHPTDDDDELFRLRFELPAMRSVQASLLASIREVDEPELFIVESPTGEGKTAAALAGAEVLAARFGLGGLIFALPTRATSDAIFSEVHRWLARAMPAGESITVALAHGNAQFNDEFGELPRTAGIFDENGPECGRAVAHWWLSGRGKSITLSSIVVGTIDQILIAGLVAKHAVLRHLGLAGKVVILDEVHAADPYMAQYLTRVLTWLGAYRVPVIALSATLPPGRRQLLLDAYNCGRGRNAAGQQSQAYPLLTRTAEGGALSVEVAASSRRSEVIIEELPGDPEEIADAALAACVDGGHIVVVCNTVTRAQAVFRRLRAAAVSEGPELVLLHSRFLTPERVQRERLLRDELGPHSPRSAMRRLIVVATQVVEQSLDVDFDLMFSDIAPIDLLIQRAGRLHRHKRSDDQRPPSMQVPRLLITGFARVDGEAPELDRGCRAVYGAAALLRAVSVLDEHRDAIGPLRSPDDVATLVARGYADDLVPPPGWEGPWVLAERRQRELDVEKCKRADAFRLPPPAAASLQGWDSASVADGEKGLAQVRDSDDAIEVVLVQRISGRLYGPSWVDELADRDVDLGTVIEDEIAQILARNTVRLPSYLGRGKTGDDIIEELERNGVDCWQNSRWLRGMLPLVLDEDRRAVVAGHSIYYDTELGLVVDFSEGQ